MRSLISFLLILTFSNLFSQPSIWSTINLGGKYNSGTIFRADNNGNNLKAVHYFGQGANIPGKGVSYIIKGQNGKIYGIREKGGKFDYGVLFEYDPVSNEYLVKVDFKKGEIESNCPISIIQHSNGKLYGLTRYQGYKRSLFEYDIKTDAFHRIMILPRGELHTVKMFETKYGKIYWHMEIQDTTEEFRRLTHHAFCEYNPLTKQFNQILLNLDNYHSHIVSLALDDKKEFIYGYVENSDQKQENNLFFKYDLEARKFVKRINVPEFDGRKYIMQVSNDKAIGWDDCHGNQGFKEDLFEFNFSTGKYSKRYPTGNFSIGDIIRQENCLAFSKEKMYEISRYGGLEGTGLISEFDIPQGVFTEKLSFSNNPLIPFGEIFFVNDNLRGFSKTVEGDNIKGALYEYNILSHKENNLVIFKDRNVDGSRYEIEARPYGSLLQTDNDKWYFLSGDQNLGAHTETIDNKDPRKEWIGGFSINCFDLYEYNSKVNSFKKAASIQSTIKTENSSQSEYFTYHGPLIQTRDKNIFFLATKQKMVKYGPKVETAELLFCQYNLSDSTLSVSNQIAYQPFYSKLVISESDKIYIGISPSNEKKIKFIEYDVKDNKIKEKTIGTKNNEQLTSWNTLCSKDNRLYLITEDPNGDDKTLYELDVVTGKTIQTIKFKVSGSIIGPILPMSNGNFCTITYKEKTKKIAIVEFNVKTKNVSEKSETNYEIDLADIPNVEISIREY